MGLSPLSTAGSFFPGATQVSANGQRDANQRVTLDGVIASEPLVNTVYFNPSIDAIEEVKVQTGSYSAEYGMNNGANVQVALKSGTNRISWRVLRVPAQRCGRCQGLLSELPIAGGHRAAIEEPPAPQSVRRVAGGAGDTARTTTARTNVLELQLRRHAGNAGVRAAGLLVSAGVPQWRFFGAVDSADPQWRAGPGADHHLRSADRRAIPRRCRVTSPTSFRPAGSTRTRRISSTSTCRCRSSRRRTSWTPT